MQTKSKANIALMMGLPVVVFGALYFLTGAMLDGESGVSSGVMMALLIAAGLGVPYAILKLVSKNSRREEPSGEKEVTLTDLPKNKDEWTHTRKDG